MTKRNSMIAVSVALMYGAVFAQTQAVLPIKCPYDTKVTGLRLLGGGLSILSAGNSILECKPNGCQVKVKVASYKPDYQPERCCSYIEHGTVVALKKPKKDDPPIDLTWVLESAEAGNDYVFGTVNPISLTPLAQPNDFDAPKFKKKGEVTLPSVNRRFSVFNYGLTIFRANSDGSYLACDPNDPVIVNQGD